MQPRSLTVSEVTQYIKRMISNDPILHHLYVKGEVSNFKAHSSGHWYFTLKDQHSRLSCVMFASHSQKVKFQMENGMKIRAHGYISLYERDGQYQLYATELEPEGIGALYTAYLQLKDKLEQEGLFHPGRKRALPYLPEKIGLITSPTGAAVRDMISVLRRRFPSVELLVFPVLVQGEGAKASLVRAIEQANRYPGIEVILLGRGGGSIEELWAFNEEEVARAIFSSQVPVISAVGHETDFTIADFVADLRAPTPSVAAELAVPPREALFRQLELDLKKLNKETMALLESKRNRLQTTLSAYGFRYPLQRIFDLKQRTDALGETLHKLQQRQLEQHQNRLVHLAGRLESLSPLSIIKRGYGLVQTPQGKLISSVDRTAPGEILDIRLRDGRLTCQVLSKTKEETHLEKTEI